MSSSSISVHETLDSIFADLPSDRLFQRRPARPSESSSTEGIHTDNVVVSTTTTTDFSLSRDTKRPKRETMSTYYLHPDVIRHISTFLDPFELQAWTCCCKATRDACTFVTKMDSIFSWFRILKRHADKVFHEAAHCDRKAVMNLMLLAMKELRNVYGPYEVHPLHRSAIGEVLFLSLAARRAHGQQITTTTTLNDVWCLPRHYGTFKYDEYFVMGNYSDWFDDDVHFLPYAKANAKKFPKGPARVLSEEGRLPYISMFCCYDGEDVRDTAQFGILFTQDKDIPTVKVFSAVFREAPGLDDRELQRWYNGLLRQANAAYCHSIAHAFCQHIPFHDRWDDWTQLLRAGWLKAHHIPPFDNTDHGKMLWGRLVQSMKPKEWNGTTTEADSEVADMEGEVLHLYPTQQERIIAKQRAKSFLRQRHDWAKWSDYQQ